jgi:hypothetical protein
MTAMSLLAGLYPDDDLRAYHLRQRCSPQPGMRRVVVVGRAYECWLYEQHAWNRGLTLTDRTEALSWWLGDPWLPNHRFEYGALADGADFAASGQDVGDDRAAGWDAGRWEEAATALAFHIVMETGARPHDVGPTSTETAASASTTQRSIGARSVRTGHEPRRSSRRLRPSFQ